MSNDERICSIALTLCPGVGHIGAKRLVDTVGSAADVFRLRTELPERFPSLVHASVVVVYLDAWLEFQHVCPKCSDSRAAAACT